MPAVANPFVTTAHDLLLDAAKAQGYCARRAADRANLRAQMHFALMGPHALVCTMYEDVQITLYLRSQTLGHVQAKGLATPIGISTLDQALAYILARFW